MKKIILFLLVIIIVFTACDLVAPLDLEEIDRTNEYDPEGEDFSGTETVDTDGDGISSWEDVDEIQIEGSDEEIVYIDINSIVLIIKQLNPEVITAYRIQISTDNNFASNIVLDEPALDSNEFTVPAGTLANNTTYY
jgi:hypothetical protein